MMTYEKPKMTMICKEDTILKKTPDELCIWEIDRESKEVVISCCFEKIEPWEYLAGIGKPMISKYVEELDEKECFRRLEEPRTICRIECDVEEEGVTVFDLNHCEPWEFGIGTEPREGLWGTETFEEYNACFREELYPRRIAVRKDNLWWIVGLDHLQIWEPAFRSLTPLSNQCGLVYERGNLTDDWMTNKDFYYEDPKKLYFLNCESLLVGETEEGHQFGLYFNGFDDKCEDLQGGYYEQEFYEGEKVIGEPWTKISNIGGNLVLLEREVNGRVVEQKVMNEFEEVVVEDTPVDILFGETYQTWGTYPLMWFEKRDQLTIANVEDNRFGFGRGSFDDWYEVEDHPMGWRNELPKRKGISCYRVMDVWEKNRTLEVEGRGPGRFRALCGTDCVPGKWDYAEIFQFTEDPEDPLFLVKKDGLWGIIDRDGVIQVPLMFLKKQEAEERGKLHLHYNDEK